MFSSPSLLRCESTDPFPRLFITVPYFYLWAFTVDDGSKFYRPAFYTATCIAPFSPHALSTPSGILYFFHQLTLAFAVSSL